MDDQHPLRRWSPTIVTDEDGNPVAKQCARCLATLPINEFYRRKRGGFTAYCKKCTIEYSKEWQNEHGLR